MGSRPSKNSARAVLVSALLAGLAAPPAFAKKGAGLDVRPGPAEITAEERAIEPDPASGAEHAVVLVEETERNDNLIGESERAYHLRAKILSNEGRDLADVEIPFIRHEGKLREWWARTILPDGRVLELIFESPRTAILSVEIAAPPGFAPAEPPPPVETESPYGSYRLTVAATARGFRVVRSLVLRPLEVPPGEYEALRRFLFAVRGADLIPVVFRREEPAG